MERVERPNSSWSFLKFGEVELKVVWDRQALRIGAEALPDWLRNKKGMIALDPFEDSLCVFRCLAVHRGATKQRNMRKTWELANSFFRGRLCEKITFGHTEVMKHFKQGIAVYVVLDSGHLLLIKTPSITGQNPMVIGVYSDHSFLIIDLSKFDKAYAFGQCDARFTKAANLSRHATHCNDGETQIECP